MLFQVFFFFKQKTAYEMRISDWSSDVCSSDLTLSFFGVKPSDTIVEIWPGGGWYSEILGPLTRNKGKLYLAAPSRTQASLKAMIAEKPSLSEETAAIFPAEADATAVPDGVADVLLTFRNVPTWRFGGKDTPTDRNGIGQGN